MREISTPTDVLTGLGAEKPESIRRIWLLILLVMLSILVAVATVAPRPIWTASQVVLFVLTLLLCSAAALVFGVTEYRAWRARTQEGLTPTTTQGSAIPETHPPCSAAGPQGDPELNSLIRQAVADQQNQERRLAELASTLQTLSANVAALGETLQAQGQATCEAIVTLTGTQGQWIQQTEELQATLETVAAGVRDVAREQAAVGRTLQEQGRLLTAADERIGAVCAEQTARDETIGRLAQEVGRIGTQQAALDAALRSQERALSAAVAALAADQGKLADDLQGLHELTQGIAGSVAEVACEQAAVCGAAEDNTRILTVSLERMQQAIEKIGERPVPATAPLTDEIPPLPASQPTAGQAGSLDVGAPASVSAEECSSRLHAAQAVTHGEQIRYEIGPDRDNLGFWANANDWAEWTLDVAQPGRFKVMAEIAAVGGGRFQVILAEQTLAGTAPDTGDYGRFQQVELGTVELAVAGKTQVAVRPIPDGWQPMNLRSLDLVTLPA